jgi:hypothetical protein
MAEYVNVLILIPVDCLLIVVLLKIALPWAHVEKFMHALLLSTPYSIQ